MAFRVATITVSSIPQKMNEFHALVEELSAHLHGLGYNTDRRGRVIDVDLQTIEVASLLNAVCAWQCANQRRVHIQLGLKTCWEPRKDV